MLAKAYVSHQTENRIRFYLPQEKGNTLLFSDIKKKLPKCEEVDQIQTNSITGSVLVLYSGDLSNVIHCAKKNLLFKVEPALEGHKKWTVDLIDRLEKADKRVTQNSNGDLNLVSLAALGLFGAGVFQLSRKMVFPAASSLFTDAFRLLVQVNRKNLEDKKIIHSEI
ncbi:MAG: HMA2 domain-containing protein [Bdellovibrionia bacterium]